MNISDATGFVPLRGTSRSAAPAATTARPQVAPTGLGEARPGEVESGSGKLGSEVAGRLDAAVEKLRDKLAELSAGRELNAEQISQLREAEAHLQSTLERIHNALDDHGLTPSTLRLGFRSAVGEMQTAIQDVLAADGAAQDDGDPGRNAVSLGQAGALTQAERLDGGRDEAPADPVLRRLAHAEERMAGRIDELLESPDLTDEQRKALEQTGEEFGATLDRLRNAMEGGAAPVTVARGYRVALSQFRQGVDGAIGNGDGRASGGGTTSVIDPGTARRMEQLHAAGERIEQRLDNMISREGLGEHQIAALEEAREGFQASLAELRGSLLDSGLDVADVRSAFMEALDGLVDDVHGALHEEGPKPALYTAAQGIDPLGTRGQGSLVDHQA